MMYVTASASRMQNYRHECINGIMHKRPTEEMNTCTTKCAKLHVHVLCMHSWYNVLLYTTSRGGSFRTLGTMCYCTL